VDIAIWLRELGLERYEQAFQDHDIAPAVLPELTDQDLRELGVSLGHRRLLLKAIRGLANDRAGQGQAEVALVPLLEPVPRPQAERRQLTVLFCDLVGSTELATRLDPEDLREIMRTYQAACADVVRQLEGHVARFLGDGVLAYFGWPRAHEDDAERAVRAGLRLAGDIAGLEPRAEVRLQARVGVATGHVVVGDLISEGVSDKDAVSGDTPNLAARLQAVATPGSVVISQATRRLVGGLFELEDLGPQRLKGFAEPLVAWLVAGEGQAEGRFEARQTAGLTPLVGREEEIALLLRRWQQARDGEGQVLLLSGEPGIGKSRLVRELRERIAAEPHVRLAHQGSPYHQTSPLHPIIEHLERAAGFERDDPPKARLAKLETLLARGTDKLDQAVPLIAGLLGVPTDERYPALELTPQRQKELMFEALLEQLAALAAEQPVLVVHEDVHWIDPTTQELLGLAIERIPRLPILLLITFRPEFISPWSGQPHVGSLALTRLGRRDGARMVKRVVGAKVLPAEVSDQIVAKTDGVPLFVEELTKAVIESGLLTDVGDHYELRGSLPPLAIPATLHDSLMARLDRLAPVKEVAQLGAVIGNEFSQELLAAVADRPVEQLRSALDQLVASELVFRRGELLDAIYTFKHALVQDVAYGSLLKSRREQLHARIARVLEDRFPETAAIRPELLAQHYTAAGVRDRAIEYWQRAGQLATERSSDLEAIAHLNRGLELARMLPERVLSARLELKLQVALGEPLVAVKGYGSPEAGATYARALTLCRELDDSLHLFPAIFGLWHFYYGQAEFYRARDLGNELLSFAERCADPSLLVAAHQALGQSLYNLGKFAAARKHLEQAQQGLKIKLNRSPHLRYGVAPEVQRMASLAQLLLCLGYPDQALQRSREAIGSARELRHPHSLACSMYFAIRLHLLRGETREADQLADAAFALSTKHGFTLWTALIVFMQGWSLYQQGRATEGIVRMRTGQDDARATGHKASRTMYYALLGEAYGHIAQPEEAWRMLAKAMSSIEEGGQRYYEAEAYRLKGELHLQEADPDLEQAEACLQRALEIARRQQAKSWELRAATSLARLWAEQGERRKAHDLLAPVYGWFTEGFDTADLRNARALLDEMS
jgi:predicted ATPase/class 3 adenylate cyclase